MLKIRRALISVSDKEGLIALAQRLKSFQIEIISTGGTKKALEEAGITVTPIETVTGNPEAFGGRMKTISFQIESALLYRRDVAADIADAKKWGIAPIDLVVCNLYPFAQAVKKGASNEELIEQIDVGGPTMIRASAKNYTGVALCTDPGDYPALMQELQNNQGGISFITRRNLALKAFALTAAYDQMIANQLSLRFNQQKNQEDLSFNSGINLRYGENPHQAASFHAWPTGRMGVGNAPILQGKELSYNNLLDADAAWKCMSDVNAALSAQKISGHCVTIVKHLNPCGVAQAKDPMLALQLAWDADPVSAFGGIIALSSQVGGAQIEFLSDKFIEVMIAPDYTPEALELLSRKKNLRVLKLAPKTLVTGEHTLKSIYGGVLTQAEDEGTDPEFVSVTHKAFPQELFPLAHFGVMVNKYLKSNSVVLVARNPQGDFIVVGAGMGQPNRVDALKKLAAPTARARHPELMPQSVLISDAFFPFADSIEVCAAEGIRFIVQPGGSIRDKEVIQAADKHEISMVFTGRRHFRH